MLLFMQNPWIAYAREPQREKERERLFRFKACTMALRFSIKSAAIHAACGFAFMDDRKMLYQLSVPIMHVAADCTLQRCDWLEQPRVVRTPFGSAPCSSFHQDINLLFSC